MRLKYSKQIVMVSRSRVVFAISSESAFIPTKNPFAKNKMKRELHECDEKQTY